MNLIPTPIKSKPKPLVIQVFPTLSPIKEPMKAITNKEADMAKATLKLTCP